MNSRILFCLLLTCVAFAHPAMAFDPSLSDPTALPNCPRGCTIHIYGPLKETPDFLPPDARKHTDWTEYYKACGVAFAKGGFAFYYKPSKTLIIATTPADFSLIETVMGAGSAWNKFR